MLRRKVLSLATGLVCLLATGLASAQETTTPPPAPPAAEPAPAAPAATVVGEQPAAAAAPAERTEEIVVTGSRIRRKDLNTPAPVTVINKEQIQASGKVTIGDFLQSLPEQGNAINTGVNNGGDGSTRVSLRGIGSRRTLVLVNGRRFVQSGIGIDSSVDLNAIPTAAIERIEVLKDGASAVYGSDAVGGVVNIITRRKFNGTEANAYGGVAGQGDGGTLDLNLTTGTSSDKGSILFSGGYFNQRKIMAGDRNFSKYQLFYDANGLNNAEGIVGEYAAGSSRTPGGRIRANGTGNAAWDALLNDAAYQAEWATLLGSPYLIHDSSLTASTPAVAACLAAGAAQGITLSDCQWRPMNQSNMAGLGGDLYNFAPVNYLVTPMARISLYSSGDANFAEFARGYFEASYVNRQSGLQLAPEPLIIGPGGVTDTSGNLVSISADNIYNPFGKDFTLASRRLEEFGPRTDKFDADTFRVVAGVDGTLPEVAGPITGWFWDVSYSYGRNTATDIHGGSLQSSRVQDALGPSMVVDGVPICVRVPGDATSQIGGCTPFDLFHGSGSITADQVAGLAYTGTNRGTNSLNIFQANASGELFTLWAERPAGLAIGYEWRAVGGTYTNDPLVARFDSTNGGSADTAGSYTANEGYAELSVPLVSNMPWVQDLEGSAAVRVFNYSNFGSDATYKFGARYRPVPGITLRGTYSTAFRAPSIPELFQGLIDDFPNVSDPCATADRPNCGDAAFNGDDSDQLKTKTGGNADLKAETANIYTVGVVWEPNFVRNLSVTLDYYNLTVDDAITRVGASTILAGCYGGGQPQYCDLIHRDPLSHQINFIDDLQQNVGKEQAAGIDIAARYAIPTPNYGRFGLTFDGTWLLQRYRTLPDGTKVNGKGNFDLLDRGQGGVNPAFKFNAGVVWGLKGFGAGVATKFISSFKECGNEFGDFSGDGLCYVDNTFQRKVDAYNTYDVFLSYRVASAVGRTTLSFGVNNLFDTSPPKIYNGFASATDQYNYDQIGRFFYLALNQAY